MSDIQQTTKSTEEKLTTWLATIARRMNRLHYQESSDIAEERGEDHIALEAFTRENLLDIAASCWLMVDRAKELGELAFELASDKK